LIRRVIVGAGSLVIGERSLDRERSHYVKDVLRLRAEAELELCDGEGQIARARVRAIDKGGVKIAIERIDRAPDPLPPAITLLQGIGKGEKMDAVVRQATELGVRRIVPVASARAVADRAGKIDRWRTIAEDAIRVSGRAHLPRIDPPAELREILEESRAPLAICADTSGARSFRDLLTQPGIPQAVELLVGPEGGFTDEERAAIEAAGFVRARFGLHTLRTETAGPAMVAVLLYGFGVLGQ
jgi:16S rRNA (uracil1498-N3)-methyltransferase